MTDREVLLYMAKLLGVLTERVTGERISIEVETENGTLQISTSVGVPGSIPGAVEALAADLRKDSAKRTSRGHARSASAKALR
jgi:hypothetical protein